MSLFRVDPDHPFRGPHQGLSQAEHGASLSQARAVMVMVHGRGATAKSMFPLADELAQPDFHFRAPQAHNHTWYPYSFLAPKEQNQPGISSGIQMLHDVLQDIAAAGIPREKIMLLGFSQGACLATEFAARHPRRLGGIVAFSGGLIGPDIDESDYTGSMDQAPVFLGCSDVDPHIPKERVDKTEEIFSKLNANVTKQIYKGMGHTINEDEIKATRRIMADVLNS
ncbi:MAG TPA: alpha/beta fold hydrolase [Balneolaceae bacterium]|nr:alpha/beta fold hydrolase [Balneolaceae bacterium]